MNKKIKFVLMLISLSISLGLMSSTYSRYVATTNGDINASFSKWQILVANNDITSNTNSTLTLTPTIENQENVLKDTIAPTTKGYFDIAIDPSNADVSFKYSINLELDNDNIPDLMITKYAILPSTYIEGDTINFINNESNIITDNLYFNNTVPGFKFSAFTIRVYFEWYDGENTIMGDEDDTNIGLTAAENGETFKVSANITFEQII